VIYRPRSSPLHAARAGVGSLYCVVLAGVALSFEHPVILLALLAALLAAGTAAGVGREVRRGVLWGVPFALLWVLINALVSREGLTVIFRAGELPALGRIDITAEAVAYGGILGLRAMIVIGCFALHSAAVDPDDLLRVFRRLSFRSALTASLATRLLPVLARDARRLDEAQRCRGVAPASRTAIVRAVASGALDRAVDVAATLEVRGYGAAHRPRRVHRPWSRHDLGFAAAVAALAAIAIAAFAGGWEPFDAYPRTRAPIDAAVVVLSAALAACALLPFLDRRGVGRR
jgi:energy-coupling factor transport system permease protein